MARLGLSRSVLPASAHTAAIRKGRTIMALVFITKAKDVTIEDFRAVSAKHNPPQDIDGLLAWAAGTDENGLNVVTVWQSKAHQERFAAEQLFPVFQEFGMAERMMANSEFTEYEAGEFYVR
jgi:heme-degrading monooxygenase HmoA